MPWLVLGEKVWGGLAGFSGDGSSEVIAREEACGGDGVECEVGAEVRDEVERFAGEFGIFFDVETVHSWAVAVIEA